MREEFLKELKDLMEKYRVSIGFSVSECSDTHGLYDEKIVIDHQVSGFKSETWLKVDGWGMASTDIEIGRE